MALIPPEYFDCVVALGIFNEKKEKIWVGTGFLVGRLVEEIPSSVVDNKPQKIYSVFLVTNRHVLKDLNEIIVRFNPQEGGAARDYPVPLKENGRNIWKENPDGTTDLAIIRLNGKSLQDDSIKFSLFGNDTDVATIQKMKEIGVSEGDSVFVLGFPLGIVDPEWQYVISRGGVIARIRDLLDGRRKNYLIDANIFPGNSGGPVILKPEMVGIQGTKINNSALMIGIVSGYLPYRDVAISAQTKQTRVVFEENSGLASILPTDFIFDVIEHHFPLSREAKTPEPAETEPPVAIKTRTSKPESNGCSK